MHLALLEGHIPISSRYLGHDDFRQRRDQTWNIPLRPGWRLGADLQTAGRSSSSQSHVPYFFVSQSKKQPALLSHLIFCPSESSAEAVHVCEAAREEQLGSPSLLVRVQPARARASGRMSCLTHRQAADRRQWRRLPVSEHLSRGNKIPVLVLVHQGGVQPLCFMCWSLIGCILCLYSTFLCARAWVGVSV